MNLMHSWERPAERVELTCFAEQWILDDLSWRAEMRLNKKGENRKLVITNTMNNKPLINIISFPQKQLVSTTNTLIKIEYNVQQSI